VETIDEPIFEIACTVNGTAVRTRVPVRRSLVDWLRHDVGLTGSHIGCEHGVCDACHVVQIIDVSLRHAHQILSKSP
jgi:aerobic-type carbon monoxide dehydrogenase small subunit (CoxS/CutS family)